ncbi:MAG: pyridoxal phosphate-dependent aminotransferase [Pyrinomonadaceae bacterium]
MIQPSQRTANFHYAIRNIIRAAEARERAGRDVLHFNIGDPQSFGFRPPEHVCEPVARVLREGFTGYAHSAGLPEARQAVAAYATALGAPTTPRDVLITAGASEAADLLLGALVNEGEEVLVPAPGYPVYTAILNKLGARARFYRLDQRRGWQPSPEEIASLVNPRTRAIVLINPNNPTGSILPDRVTEQILELAARHRLLVIADEVYRELCFEAPPTSASVLAERMNLPLVTLESLSKTHMIPGWRAGWMRFTHGEQMPDLIAAIGRLADGRLCSPTPAQYAVRPALEGSWDFLRKFTEVIRRRRDFAVGRVRETQGALSCVEPAAAFYLLVQVAEEALAGRTDEQFVLDLLEETGVLFVQGSGFGTDPREGFFRLVYLADETLLGQAFARVREFLTARAR